MGSYICVKNKGHVNANGALSLLSNRSTTDDENNPKLVKQGYVRQVPGDDKRTKKITLTDLAYGEYPNWENAVIENNMEILVRFLETKQDQLQNLLDELLSILKHQEESGGNK
jgi:MarR family transcriptional regulator for hemolysin